MHIEIPRIRADDLSIEEFLTRFYVPEQPVVLTDLEPPSACKQDALIWALAHEADAEWRNGHIAAGTIDGGGRLRVPALVAAMFGRADVAHKSKPLKLWMQPRGHCSLLHYDGNSLHGLNWQIAGRKHWLLISPKTPVRMMPFTWVAMARENFTPDPARYDVCEIRTQPGDMLFLPRYWAHRVTCEGDSNVNLNWVWTPITPNVSHPVGRRECATLKLRSWLGRLDRLVRYRVAVSNYGDGGEALFRSYAGAADTWLLCKTFAHEVGNAMLLPFFGRDVEQQMQRMRDNNFPETLKPE
jgi:hypothetical protein